MRSQILFAAIAAFAFAGPAAADLADIKKSGELIAATSGNLPPNTYMNEKNELTGYDIEVCRHIAKAIGVKIAFERLDWKGVLPGVQTGRFHMACSNVNITEERKGIFDYSIPYSRAAVVPVIRKGVTNIASFKDLKGKNVGAITGGNDGEIPARAIEKEFGAFASFKGYPGYAEMFTDMRAGRLDAIIAPDLAAADYIKKFPGEASFAGEPYQVRYVGLPMTKGSPELKAAVDAAINKARTDGTLDKLAQQFFGIAGFSKQLVDKVP